VVSRTQQRLRQTLQELERFTEDADQYVDFGIEIRVVEQASGGRPAIPGTPPVHVLRRVYRGGILDTQARRVVAECNTDEYRDRGGRPHVWYLSEHQARLVLHGEELGPKLLVYGAMGASKSHTLACWCVLQVLEHYELSRFRTVAIGCTAPTQDRRDSIVKLIQQVCHPSWYRFYVVKNDFVFARGVSLELRATKMQSQELGSPLQGQTYMAIGSDELQDSTRAHADIEMRGRGAPGGVCKRLCTATAKDSMQWRAFRDDLGPLWSIERLLGPSNFTVWPKYWEGLKDELSEREYRMKVLALDVGPERAVYPNFDRDKNLRPVSGIDITHQILGHNRVMGIGHDPGVLRNVSVMVKAYQDRRGGAPVWYVVDEFETKQTTTEEHASQLRDYLQRKWHIQHPGADEPRVVVRNDPWSNRDSGTDISVYDQFSAAGFDIKSAAYTAKGEGRGHLSLKASVETVARLIVSASGVRRLFIALKENGKPAAPNTLQSLELSEWDAWGHKHIGRKDDKRKDPTDYETALRYILHPYEKFRRQEGFRRGVAL
jgi:hypothetical protein